MGLVQASSEIIHVPDDQKFRYIQLCLQDIINQINGAIQIDKNLRISIVTVNFQSANENVTVNHGLGGIPQGYIEVGKSVSMNVYDGTEASTNTTISLKSNAVGQAKLLFF